MSADKPASASNSSEMKSDSEIEILGNGLQLKSMQQLQSSPQGLTETEAQLRLEKYGPNILKARQELTPLKLFLNQFKSPIVLILIFATLLSAFLKDWADAIIILLIVLGSAILSFVQENNAHNAADKLRAASDPQDEYPAGWTKTVHPDRAGRAWGCGSALCWKLDPCRWSGAGSQGLFRQPGGADR